MEKYTQTEAPLSPDERTQIYETRWMQQAFKGVSSATLAESFRREVVKTITTPDSNPN